jgi:tetratricopeptide (TPR) repeat protein
MSDSVTIASLLYLSMFRLSIIAVGALSIYLGYKLFIGGIGLAQGGEGAAVEATLGNTSFALKNAAPGTFFALFGVIVISTMLINAPAEVKHTKDIKPAGEGSEQQTGSETLVMRGADDEKSQQEDAALAIRLNNYAWDLQDKQRTEDALTFAMLALRYAPQKALILDSIASFLFNLERFEEALQYKKQAIAKDGKFTSDLSKYETAVNT